MNMVNEVCIASLHGIASGPVDKKQTAALQTGVNGRFKHQNEQREQCKRFVNVSGIIDVFKP